MPATLYLTAYSLPILCAFSLYLEGAFTLLVPGYAFVLLPLLELILPAFQGNPTPDEEKRLSKERIYDWMLYGMVPFHCLLVGVLLFKVAYCGLTGFSLLGSLFSVGICGGAVGINVAHELGHRKTSFERRLAKILLLSTLYMHFYIEHNRGHHAHVATDQDPASSREGEWLYLFWIRSLIGGMISAWNLEVKRLQRRGERIFSLKNEALLLYLTEGALLGGITLTLGAAAAATFFLTALVSILLLETVNYIEHYGLRRERLPNGRFEPVRPIHSWNANFSIGRGILFELTRHSDHHANPTRKYPLLRHFDESPQLPTGYPGMILLATLPPLFFFVMDHELQKWKAGQRNSCSPSLQWNEIAPSH